MSISFNRLTRTVICGIVTLGSISILKADGDWPQWRGPHRDGHAAPQTLLSKWPEGGPKLVWSFDQAGVGYSSPSVQDDKLFVLGKRGGENLLLCVDAKTGKEVWKASLGSGSNGKEYAGGWGDGPRSSPTIDGDRVFALSDLGKLGCFDKEKGNAIWAVDLVKDLGGEIPKWGYSESVLVDGDRVIVTPGNKTFLVGLDKKSGKKIWESKFAAGAQYVSVIKHDFDGVPVYLSACDQGLVGIHCETGELLFKNASTGNGTAVIPTPIVSGNLVYHSSGYKAGNAAVKIDVKNGVITAKELYHESKESMENHHGGFILHDGVIVGFSKALRGVWMGQDIESGKVLWSKKIGRGTSGSIAFADGLVYCYDDQDGICYLAKATRSGWEQLGQVALPEQTSTDRKKGAIWTPPVIANQKLIIRDQEKIFAFDIAATK